MTTIFRKVGGFVHIVSVLVSLEGCLKMTQDPPFIACDTYRLLQSVFACLAVAMRYEPANAWHFQVLRDKFFFDFFTFKSQSNFDANSEKILL